MTRRIFALLVLTALSTLSTAKAQDMSDVKFSFVETNGVKLRIAEMGEGPLVLLLHGWPESWYSWRHQLPALAKAGYRAVAPDLRGYGESDKPKNVEDYDIVQLTNDAAGIVEALGEKDCILVGHDWGAVVGWQCLLLRPERFKAYVAMSVPYGGRPKQSLITSMQSNFKDNFFYILYFQQNGVADKEFDSDPRGIVSRLYCSPDTPREAPTVTDPKMAAGGWIPRLGAPKELPPWLKQEDLDYYVDQFTKAGFTGGINFYRNFHRNWEITPQLDGVKVKQPVTFIAGEKDSVVGGATAEQLTKSMGRATEDLRGVKLIPGIGHWVQQEAVEETNAAMIEFIKSIE